MKQRVKTRFKDEIRKVLIAYALAPIGALVAIFLVGLALLWNHSMIQLAEQECAALSELLQTEGVAYLQMLEQTTRLTDQAMWNESPQIQAEFNADIYSFLSTRKVRGSFYLLDANGAIRFSTEHDMVLRSASEEQLKWFLPRLGQQQGSSMRYCRYPFLGGSRADLQIGQALVKPNGEVRGYVAFVLSEQDFMQAVSGRPASVVVTNRYGHIFLSNTAQFNTALDNLATPMREADGFISYAGAQYFVKRAEVLAGDLWVYAAVDYGDMLQIISLMAVLSFAILLGVMGLIIASASTISRRKTRIIDEIVEAFLAAKGGRLDNYLQISTNDEFETIGETYNAMLDSLRDLIHRNEEQAKAAAIATIQQLESQFNPHFLFNTLENVRFMIRMDARVAEQMVVDLSKLLRYSIQYAENSVSMAEDIENTKSYLRILKYRFGDRFHYKIVVPEQLLNCRIPKLIFQPIIENAVQYGMEGQASICVTLEIREQDGGVVAVISDDGAGISNAQLTQLRENLKNPRNQTEHIGLYNVHKRLTLLYGARFGLQIESDCTRRGTQVSLRFAIDRPDTDREGELEC